MAARVVYKKFRRLNNNFLCLYSQKNGFPSLIHHRTILSEAYSCQEAWDKRLKHPLLQDVKPGAFFAEIDKKFQTKRIVSGAHIDTFANALSDGLHFEELEHLLYRFRRTKRAVEILESTCHATVNLCLNFENYDALLRMLEDKQNYGLFPDLFSYNLIMDRFLKLERFRDAAGIAVLMMLQEDLSNPISRILGLKSCQTFLDKESFESWERVLPQEEQEQKEEEEEADEDEETLVRVPFIRNPWFDDHFEIQEPRLLIGKTLYLIGRQEHNVMGNSYRLIGLAMYEKWGKIVGLLDEFAGLPGSEVLTEDTIEKFMEFLLKVEDENIKNELKPVINEKLEKLKTRLSKNSLEDELDKAMKRILELEQQDINAQTQLFEQWEKLRCDAHALEVRAQDKERRMEAVAKMKEELHWEEKYLFYFENELNNREEEEKVDEIISEHAKKASEEDYKPPMVTKRKVSKLSALRKKAMVKKL